MTQQVLSAPEGVPESLKLPEPNVGRHDIEVNSGTGLRCEGEMNVMCR